MIGKLIKQIDILPLVAVLSLVFRAYFPFQTQLAILSLFVFYVVYINNEGLKITIVKLIKHRPIYLLGVVSIITLGAIILTSRKTSLLDKELFRVLSTIAVCIAMLLLSEKRGIKFIVDRFYILFQLYVFALLVSLIWQLHFVFNYSMYEFSKAFDQNMLTMYFLISIVILLFNFATKSESIQRVLLKNLILFLFTLILIYLGSRRGLILLAFTQMIFIAIVVKNRTILIYLKRLSIFIILFTISLTILFFVFIDNNLRYFIKYSNPNMSGLTFQLNEAAGDFYSIFGYKDQRDLEFFNPTPLLGNHLRRKIIEKFNNGEFSDKYIYMNSLALFVDSRDELNQLMPDAIYAPDSIFEKREFTNIPKAYNVDYSFKNLFYPIGIKNSNLVECDTGLFDFQIIEPNSEGNLLYLLPISDSSKFTLQFDYMADSGQVNFKLLDFQTRLIQNCEIYDEVLEDGWHRQTCLITILSRRSNYCRWEISFNSDLLLRNIKWERTRLSKNWLFSPLQNFDNNRHYERSIAGVKNKDIEIPAKIDYDRLLSDQNYVLRVNHFQEYKSSKIEESDRTAIYFKSIENGGGIARIVPTIDNQDYAVSFITNIPPHQLYYSVKRYPEFNPNYTKFQYRNFSIDTLSENMFHVYDTFKIESSLSLRSLLHICSHKKRDSLWVKSFEYSILEPNKSFEIRDSQFKGYASILYSKKLFQRKLKSEAKDSLANIFSTRMEKKNETLSTTRLVRYKLGWEIYKKYDLLHLLFGNAMNYLDTFGKFFYSEIEPDRDYDYPHNPIISTFLYSGLVGGLIYIWFLFQVFRMYYKHRKDLGVLIIVFLISFAFSFFSGNSHFSIPFFAILSFIPFLKYG